jgi:hypothetical protein
VRLGLGLTVPVLGVGVDVPTVGVGVGVPVVVGEGDGVGVPPLLSVTENEFVASPTPPCHSSKPASTSIR